jgi:dephospho-CoA kinase
MLNVALTGNVASGKSTVASLFRRWGAVVIDADQLVREVQAPGTPVLTAIVRHFGPGYFAPMAHSTAGSSAPWSLPLRPRSATSMPSCTLP